MSGGIIWKMHDEYEYDDDEEDEEVLQQPASPSAQYMNSKVLSLSIIAVLETKVALHFHESNNNNNNLLSAIKDLVLPINPRFSSIMVSEENGEKKWKRVEVNVADHLKVPTYPAGREPEYYDERLSEYLTKISMDPLPQTRPLWEIHIFRYRTSEAAGNFIFKLHHSLGDGYSLMGALLSFLKRADDPALPLTLPRRDRRGGRTIRENFLRAVPRMLCGVVHTVTDFSWSVLKSSWVDDDRTAVHSGVDGVEFRPIVVATASIPLHHLRQIKSNLNVTINDVMTGIVSYGTRLYMQEVDRETCNGRCTSLVLFNTRATKGGYTSVAEMVKPNAETPWGNRFTFLPLPIPKLGPEAASGGDPLRFVFEAHRMVRRQINSASIYLNAHLIEFSRKLRGPEATTKMIRGTLKNTSITMSNMIGPVEEASILDHPIKGFYFFVAGAPQNVSVEMVSYMEKMRVAIVVEKDFIDGERFKSCILSAFHQIYTLAVT